MKKILFQTHLPEEKRKKFFDFKGKHYNGTYTYALVSLMIDNFIDKFKKKK